MSTIDLLLISPLYLPFISPLSPLYLPYISQARGMSTIDLLLDLLRMAAVDEEVALSLTPNPYPLTPDP